MTNTSTSPRARSRYNGSSRAARRHCIEKRPIRDARPTNPSWIAISRYSLWGLTVFSMCLPATAARIHRWKRAGTRAEQWMLANDVHAAAVELHAHPDRRARKASPVSSHAYRKWRDRLVAETCPNHGMRCRTISLPAPSRRPARASGIAVIKKYSINAASTT